MDNRMKRDAGQPYLSDESVMNEQKITRRRLQKLNQSDYDDFESHQVFAKEIIPNSGEGLVIVPPFFCDYGTHIRIGENFFANYNCTILDVVQVTIGDNVMFGPNVSIYTAGHPLHPQIRNTGYEYGVPVVLGDNVWIGGNTVIMPGVTIGDNVVIGAGSVVTKDLPANMVAAGNPCRPIKEITEADKWYYYREKEFDEETWEDITRRL